MAWESRQYWVKQLSECWDSGLTIQEYSDLKDLPYETVRRWIRVLKKERAPEAASLKLVELTSPKQLVLVQLLSESI